MDGPLPLAALTLHQAKEAEPLSEACALAEALCSGPLQVAALLNLRLSTRCSQQPRDTARVTTVATACAEYTDCCLTCLTARAGAETGGQEGAGRGAARCGCHGYTGAHSASPLRMYSFVGPTGFRDQLPVSPQVNESFQPDGARCCAGALLDVVAHDRELPGAPRATAVSALPQCMVKLPLPACYKWQRANNPPLPACCSFQEKWQGRATNIALEL